ncbi:MAG: restriction endonuclease [Nitrososphaerales archaeon]
MTLEFNEDDDSTFFGLPAEFQAGPLSEGPVLVALDLIASGVPEEEAARSLTWKDFEGFCAQLLRASGYAVRENVYLSRPRAQIDLVATGPLFVINLDCKHWKRAPSRSALEGFALAQLRRSRLLRRNLDDPRPIISAILSFSESVGSFVQGVAVVPLRTLRDFLETVESYSGLLEES